MTEIPSFASALSWLHSQTKHQDLNRGSPEGVGEGGGARVVDIYANYSNSTTRTIGNGPTCCHC